jgi:outer membrane protein TolC
MYVLFSLTIFLFSSAFVQADVPLHNNLSIQSYDKANESAKVKTGYLGRSFLPSLTFELGQEKFQTGRYKSYSNPYGMLEAKLNLFRGGRDNIESGIRDLQAQIGKYNLDSAGIDELNKVRKIQWQIVYNLELIKIVERERIENSKLKEQAIRRARSGISTSSDTLEFMIYNSQLEETIESLNHENKILKIGLLPLLGLDSSEGISFSQSLEHEHDDIVMKKTYSSIKNPQVQTLNAEYESFNLQKKSINRYWTPSFDLYGGYYLYTLRDRDYVAYNARDDRVIGLRLSFELFDGLKSQNQSTATEYQAESKRLMARHIERQTDAQFLMYQEDLKHTHEVMHYVEDRIKKSKNYLTATLQEYDRGVKNSLDALTAMQRYYGYEKEFLMRKKEYQTIKSDLLAILGE